MKKLVFLAAAFVTAVSMTSCKKDYTCECTATVAGFTTTSSTTANLKKKDAESWCNGYSSSVSGSSVTCKLK